MATTKIKETKTLEMTLFLTFDEAEALMNLVQNPGIEGIEPNSPGYKVCYSIFHSLQPIIMKGGAKR